MHFSKTQRDHIPFEVEFKVTDLYNFTRIFSDFFCAKSKYINCGGLTGYVCTKGKDVYIQI